MRWAERDQWSKSQLSVIYLIEGPFLRDGGQHQHAFEPREGFADAAARAETKREISEARTVIRCGSPALGIEFQWLGPESSVAVHDPLAHEDDGAGTDVIP